MTLHPLSYRSSAALLLSLSLALGGGCSSTQDREATRLPFIVRLRTVVLPTDEQAQSAEEQPEGSAQTTSIETTLTNPALFGDAESLTAKLAESLDQAGIFELVLDPSEGDVTPDIEMLVQIKGTDFGKGSAKIGMSFVSTATWLLAGHLSWFIKDRYYPKSDVELSVTIHPPKTAEPGDDSTESRTEPPLFADLLALKDLDSSFVERANRQNWLLNIIVPPWWGDGDPQTTGTSLARRSAERLVLQERNEIQNRLPFAFFGSRSSMLVYDREADEALIASRRRIVRMEIGGETKRRTLSTIEVEEFNDRDGAVAIAGRIAALAQGVIYDSDNRYYRVPLKDLGENWVRISATLGAGGGTSQWSIYRESAASDL